MILLEVGIPESSADCFDRHLLLLGSLWAEQRFTATAEDEASALDEHQFEGVSVRGQ